MVTTLLRRRSPCALPSLLCTALLCAQLPALAQTPAPAPANLATPAPAPTPAPAAAPATARADPLDPKATVPALRYVSAFAQFRGIGDEPPVSWREANDAVARIGGWRVYLREAQQPAPVEPVVPSTAPAQGPATSAAQVPAPAATTAPKPAAPMPAGHGGHMGHKGHKQP